jgi:hypothetical protein
VIDPRALTLTQWTDAVVLTLATSAPMPKLQGDDWATWALAVVQIPSIANLTPPDPRGFGAWNVWAERFVQAVPL